MIPRQLFVGGPPSSYKVGLTCLNCLSKVRRLTFCSIVQPVEEIRIIEQQLTIHLLGVTVGKPVILISVCI